MHHASHPRGDSARGDEHQHAPPAEGSSIDPVCGMTVTPATKRRTMHAGHEVRFCSARCRGRFEADPQQYLAPVAEAGGGGARGRTGAAIRELLGMAATSARRLGAGGEETDVPLDQVHVGDRLRVRPGEKVPVDGVVLEVDGDGRVDPGREGGWRQGHRRDAQRHRSAGDPSGARRVRDAAVADRSARRRRSVTSTPSAFAS